MRTVGRRASLANAGGTVGSPLEDASDNRADAGTRPTSKCTRDPVPGTSLALSSQRKFQEGAMVGAVKL